MLVVFFFQIFPDFSLLFRRPNIRTSHWKSEVHLNCIDWGRRSHEEVCSVCGFDRFFFLIQKTVGFFTRFFRGLSDGFQVFLTFFFFAWLLFVFTGASAFRVLRFENPSRKAARAGSRLEGTVDEAHAAEAHRRSGRPWFGRFILFPEDMKSSPFPNKIFFFQFCSKLSQTFPNKFLPKGPLHALKP